MHFHIITLFPESFNSYIHTSILGRAIDSNIVRVSFYNPRDFTSDTHRRVDQKPYGGGPGMVMEALPVIKAVEKARGQKKHVKIVFFTPGGAQFTNTNAREWKTEYKHIVLVCGRYEGIDERAREALGAEEISIGPYVLTGGELPALVMMDAISRHIPGVLGDELSPEENRTSSHDVYTRPESFRYKGKTYSVPEILLSGHHKEIERWRESKGNKE